MTDQREGAGSIAEEGAVRESGVVGAEERGQVKGRTQRAIIWRRFRRHRLAMAGGVVLILLYAAALLAPWITPYEYDKIDFAAFNQAPSLEHPMGTDRLGRDELTRVLYGGRVSLMVGLGVGVFSTVIGTAVGIVSGYYGKLVDVGAMGFVDFMVTLPHIALLLVLGRLFQLTPVTITLAIVLLLWPRMARLVRGQVLAVRGQEYVMAAKAIGVSGYKIMARHILPNVVGIVVVEATLIVALAILIETAVSYLGLGIQPPTPSWGNMLSDSRDTMTQQPWLTYFPGAMIVLTALCVNFMGDGLRDALDPKAVE